MSLFNFKKTKNGVDGAIEAVDDAADEVQILAENASGLIKDNEKAVKIAIGLAVAGLGIGIIADIVSIVCCCTAKKYNSKPVVINNYMGGHHINKKGGIKK